MDQELNVRWHGLSDRQKKEALEYIEEPKHLEELLEAEITLIEKVAEWLALSKRNCYHLETSDAQLTLRRA